MNDAGLIVLPRPPESARPYRFPLIATTAPIVMSGVLWLVTGSAMAILFALLGPITAVASFVDSRVNGRRSSRRERLRFADEALALRARISELHAAEVCAIEEDYPTAASIVARRGADHHRWSTVSPGMIALGQGVVASTLRTDAAARSDDSDPVIVAMLTELVSGAENLTDAPLVVDASLGVGIFGPPALTRVAARSMALQLAWSLSPAHFWCSQPSSTDPELLWCGELPHATGPPVRAGYSFEFGSIGSSTPQIAIATAANATDLPGACRIVLGLTGEGELVVVQHPERQARQAVRISFVSRDEVVAWAIDAAQDAARHGITQPHSALASTVELLPMLAVAQSDGAQSLRATVALCAAGPVVLDLVEHGPHAVVGGTTGSGKSELLISWVVAMAAAYSPAQVNFLLVDFKGGSAFADLASLPHTVGTITDLDAREAARALASLRAELTYRERLLLEAGARRIEDAPALPRLVIVVDEFAAMLAEHPDLHSLFADLAARGRSLGIHLVLCTQRPAGTLRDSVLANADLRISLRVNNPSDSAQVVGTVAAADIPAEARGRAIVRLAGAEPLLVQFARACVADVTLVAERYRSAPKPRRPWVEPLPPVVLTVGAQATGTSFGLVDLPAEQRWGTAVWHPESDGNVLVVGAGGSGKSTALFVLGGPHAVWVPTEPDTAWDVLSELVAGLDEHGELRVVVIDDLDILLPRFSGDHRTIVVEYLTRLFREGGARGIRFVASAQRLSGELLALASLIPARLWLKHASRQELVLAGGDGATFDDRLGAGGGIWRGDRVQVVLAERVSPKLAAARETALDPDRPLAIVSPRALWLAPQLASDNNVVQLATLTADPSQTVARETTPATPRLVLVGDVDDWQSRWGALSAMRAHADVVFHGCTPSDLRSLTRTREMPPPLPADPAFCWRMGVDGTVTRTRLLF